MFCGYYFRRAALAMGSCIAWIVLGTYNYGLSTVAWDIYYMLFWLSIGLCIVAALEGMTLRPKGEEKDYEESMDDNESPEGAYRKRKERRDRRRDSRRDSESRSRGYSGYGRTKED